jgi:hypothetical protein
MKANLGMADKVVRILAAVAIGILYFTNVITGTAAIILLIVAIILVLTSLISFCPIYYLLGIKTRKKTVQS